MKEVYAWDLDGTLTDGPHSPINFIEMKPNAEAILKINKLAEEGHEIIIYTARPVFDYVQIKHWLNENGVRFDAIVPGKPRADWYIDNNSKRVDEL